MMAANFPAVLLGPSAEALDVAQDVR